MIELLLVLQLSTLEPKLQIGYNIAINGSDLAITSNCLALETCRELNWLKFVGDRPVVFGFLKMGTSALQVYAINKAYKKDKKLGRIVAYTLNGLYTGLVIHNLRQLGNK